MSAVHRFEDGYGQRADDIMVHAVLEHLHRRQIELDIEAYQHSELDAKVGRKVADDQRHPIALDRG